MKILRRNADVNGILDLVKERLLSDYPIESRKRKYMAQLENRGKFTVLRSV
jgi:ribosomal protein S21